MKVEIWKNDAGILNTCLCCGKIIDEEDRSVSIDVEHAKDFWHFHFLCYDEFQDAMRGLPISSKVP